MQRSCAALQACVSLSLASQEVHVRFFNRAAYKIRKYDSCMKTQESHFIFWQKFFLKTVLHVFLVIS